MVGRSQLAWTFHRSDPLASDSRAAVLWQRTRGPLGRALVIATLAASIGLALGVAWSGRGALVYNFRDGIRCGLEAASPVANLALSLPSLFRGSVGDAWTIAMVWSCSRQVCSRLPRPRSNVALGEDTYIRAVVAPAVIAGILTFGPAAGWMVSRRAGARRRQRTLGWRTRGVARSRCRPDAAARLDPGSATLRGLLIPGVHHGQRPPDSQAFFATGVPSGDYELVAIRLTGVRRRSRSPVGRGITPGVQRDTRRRIVDLAPLPIHLPAGAHELTVSLDRRAQREAGQLLIRPIQVLDSALPFARARTVLGDVRVWALDEKTMLEAAGFWTVGEGTTQVVSSADAPRDVRCCCERPSLEQGHREHESVDD